MKLIDFDLQGTNVGVLLLIMLVLVLVFPSVWLEVQRLRGTGPTVSTLLKLCSGNALILSQAILTCQLYDLHVDCLTTRFLLLILLGK